jgi:hypothetical protein
MRVQITVVAGLAFVSTPAMGTILYEGFDYPVGTLAEVTAASPNNLYTGRTNPFGPTWAAAGTYTGPDCISVTSPGLSAPAWLGGTGNSAEWAGPATDSNSARIETGPFRNDPAGFENVYYSFALNVSDVSVLQPSTSNAGYILAGFNTLAGPQTGSIGVIGTRLLARQHPSDTARYQLGMSKNVNNVSTVTWDPAIRDLNTTYFVVGQYTLLGTALDGNDFSRLWIDPDPNTTFGVADGSAPTPTIEATAGVDLSIGQIESLVLRQSGPLGTGASNTGIRLDEVRLGTRWADVAPAKPNSWSGASGNFSDGGQWSETSAPNAPYTLASFGTTGAPATVNVDSSHTVGSIHFSSANGYALSGTGTLALNGSSSIVVFDGSHTISAPVTVAGDLNVTTATGKSVTMSNFTMSPTARLIKSGYGDATVDKVRNGKLTIHGGRLTVAQNGGAAGMSVVGALDMPAPRSQDFTPPPGVIIDFRPRGVLDLKDNALLVRNGTLGTWNGTAYTDLQGLVQLGRNEGSWDGRGLLTSMSDATTSVRTTLAIASADDLGIVGGTFRGQTVNAGDVLVMYTWGGDADLNGELNGDDYFFIDSNILAQVPGFHNGDFDYNGEINGDDYFIIDSTITFAQNSAPFQTGGAGGLAVVPEPSSAVLFAGIAAMARRRRRK